ncbi:MAG TPA: hypothetical protein VGG20_04410 [Thermoanaerobaculia bacterium]|jgi:hypothetical protein
MNVIDSKSLAQAESLKLVSDEQPGALTYAVPQAFPPAFLIDSAFVAQSAPNKQLKSHLQRRKT